MSDGTYVYAVARDDVPVGQVTGVAGTPVRTIAGAGLVAYVSTVPLAEFGEEPLRRSLEDLDWLSETARAHHGVVEAVVAATATAPVRLVTVYGDDDQVRDLLERRNEDFLAVLTHVTGRKEWGVQAYAGRSAAPAVNGNAHPDGDAATERPGTSYLKRRQASLRVREQIRRQAARRAEDIHAALAAVAAASRRHRAQDSRLSGREESMLLNGAYLVDEGRVEEFAAVAGALGGDGVDVRLTGPWAPYSFTVLESR
ncbi:GvpL/GvpF family gas vesicle protein [Nonomuraea zeae]|uniref:GvpL/GvpF family gas vesicle protein n=1 Tax=Nonomuraea zeae TaxID=1642303 RepID=A0A5S4G7S1_9ACTN|nr:GvpL/GvpF family gas vesicle protein [Nonomuraea zeae]TMR28481.1 GvpL/GvpF family gas vesicle protein [Nonomuraea zeae]